MTYPFHYDPPKVWDGISREIVIQRACRDLIAKAFRRTDSFAVPNAGKRTRWQAAQAKREGMVKGVSDLIVIGKPGLTAFCEIKADSSLTPDQRDFLTRMVELGHRAGCFRSVDTLYLKLKEWGFQ